MKSKLLLSVLLFSTIILYSQPKGSIAGKITDFETKQSLIGVNIYVSDQNIGTTTDENGNYTLPTLPVGTYKIVISYIGYKKYINPDVLVKSGRETTINAELIPESVELQNVVVTGGYFTNIDDKPLSSVSFSNEEVRRAPGAGGDIGRILTSLPSLSKVNDQKNSLIVRGGSPVENTFFLDNIEIPNINHFPNQGSSGGGISLIDVDFLDDVSFNAGGFSAKFGDKLSSVMELKYRDGNRQSFYPQLNLSMKGIGVTLEGPIVKDKASFLFSANRSYLDLLLGSVHAEGALPAYYDFQGKISWDLDKNNKFSFINLYCNDYTDLPYDKAFENFDNSYGITSSVTYTSGLNWQHIWGNSGYSNTSASFVYQNYDYDFFNTIDKSGLFRNISKEYSFNIRNSNYINLSKSLRFETGFDIKINKNDYFFNYGKTILENGSETDEITTSKKFNNIKAGFYGLLNLSLGNSIVLTPSARADYSDFTEKTVVSPRVSALIKLSDITSVSMAAGIYYQNIPDAVAGQSDLFKSLKNPKAIHYVLGFSHMLTESIKMTLELYNKEYSNFPINPDTPYEFIFDQVVYNYYFRGNEVLSDKGEAYARGVEFMIQKKFAKDFYGLISAGYSRTKYKDLNGIWRNRVYDNKFTFALEGGYKPNESWEFSGRWIYAGGAPFTAFDKAKSQEAKKGIYNLAMFNESRLPAYHSLNLRVDKHFNFMNSNMIVYLDIWNIYNRENISNYEWSEIKNEERAAKQWSLLPVLGIEFEF